MMIMKNAKIITKLRRFTKTFSVSFLFVGCGIFVSAFKSSVNSDSDPKKAPKDSSHSEKTGFPSLFSSSQSNPSKPFFTLNPLAIPFVESYLKTHSSLINTLKTWGKPYLELYDGILSRYGLPVELKYLSVVESNLKAKVVSVAGAVGPWQMMSQTARRAGLTVNRHADERTNYSKSTHAASKILKELYSSFGDWLLVIAAYNAGSGRVNQAIKKSGSRNFWVMQKYLPLETRNHVKKFIATHFAFEGNGGLTTSTAAEIKNNQLSSALANQSMVRTGGGSNIETSEISGRYASSILIESIGIEASEFNKLNPDFDKAVTAGSVYNLHLPSDKMKIFESKRQFILNETVQSLLASPALN